MTPAPTAPAWRTIWAPALLAFLAALALGWLAGPDLGALKNDAYTYDLLARGLLRYGAYRADGGAHPEVFRTPGFPAVLAALYAVFGRSPATISVMQASFHAASVALYWRLSLSFLSPRAARLFAWGLALFPYALFGTTRVLTEPLSTALVPGLLLLVLRARKSPRAIRWLWVGLMLALGSLVRPALLPWAGPLGLLILLDPQAGFRAACASLLGLLLLTAPWAIRNSACVSAPMGIGLGLGNNVFIASFEYQAPSLSDPLDPDRDAAGYPQADAELQSKLHPHGAAGQLALDRARQRAGARRIWAAPARYLRASLLRGLRFWLSARAPGLPRWAGLSSAALSLLLLLGGLWGAAHAFRASTAEGRWPLLYLISPALSLQLLHSLLHVEGRYSYPARPLLLFFIIYGLSRRRAA